MPTLPTFERSYTLEGYSYEFRPVVSRTQFYTGNSRQRKYMQKRDFVFSVRHVLSASELSTFEAFVTDDLDNGSLTYTGPYFTSDTEYTGTLEMLDGTYQVQWLTPEAWAVSYQFELKDRDLTEEENIYDTVISAGTFAEMNNIVDLLAELVNEDWP